MSEEQLHATTEAALRPSGLGQLETTIATELAIAIFHHDPLQKIRHILEAFNLLPRENRTQIASDEEVTRFKRIHRITFSFLDIQMLPSGRNDINRYAMVPFTFRGKDAVLHFKPFIHLFHWPQDISDEARMKVINGDAEHIERYFNWLANYLSTWAFLQEVLSVKNQFIDWAMPITINLATKIIEKFITKETWEKALAAQGKGSKSGSSSADVLAF